MLDKEKYVMDFLKQAVLGQSTEMSDPDMVLRKCIKLADRDMLIGGRFAVGKFKIKKQNERVEKVFEILEGDKYRFNRESIRLIASRCFWTKDTVEILSKNGKRTYNSYGLAQKLYNMTFKYMYVFNDLLGAKHIDFSECDCPIDSVILDKLEESKTYLWTRLSADDYKNMQDKIKEELNSEGDAKHLNIGNLAYDINWTRLDN